MHEFFDAWGYVVSTHLHMRRTLISPAAEWLSYICCISIQIFYHYADNYRVQIVCAARCETIPRDLLLSCCLLLLLLFISTNFTPEIMTKARNSTRKSLLPHSAQLPGESVPHDRATFPAQLARCMR
jgi:hypothetical protein